MGYFLITRTPLWIYPLLVSLSTLTTIQIEMVLETHHRSNEGCITGRPFKQMRRSTVACENDDIEAEPTASVNSLDFKNTRS